MDHKSTIVIPNAAFIDTLPMCQAGFYYSLLGAIVDEATEMRFEPGPGFGKVWMTIKGKEYQIIPNSKEEVEAHIQSLSNGEQSEVTRTRAEEIRFWVKIRGKSTEVLASIRPEHLLLRFLDPEKASAEAKIIADELSRGEIEKDSRKTVKPLRL